MALTEHDRVVGVFREHALAEQAVQELHNAGFNDNQISLLNTGHTNSGGMFSGLKGLFGGQGQDTVSGSAAQTNTSNDPLKDMGLSEHDYGIYQNELNAGNTLVLVQPGDRQQEANDILYRYGAYNAATIPVNLGGSQTVRVRREEVQVNKQVVQTGEVRIYKRVITENKTFTVPVRREELVIEHHPPINGSSRMQVNDQNLVTERQPMTQDATESLVGQGRAVNEILQDGGAVRIVLREDQVTINKQPVIVEEVLIRKEAVQETRQLQEDVRHEEVHLSRVGSVPLRSNSINVEQLTDDAVLP